KNSCIGWERERNACKIVNRYSANHSDRGHLDDLHRPLADDMTPKNSVSRSVDDQLTEPGGAPIDLRTTRILEQHFRDKYVVCFAGFCLRETDLCIFRIGEAANRIHMVLSHHLRAAHSVRCSGEAISRRLRNQHQTSRDVACGKDMW